MKSSAAAATECSATGSDHGPPDSTHSGNSPAIDLAFLASERWAQMLRRDLLPWLLAGGTLGEDVLEIGPGPGLTTDLLRELAPAVTAVELDPVLATRLRDRLAGTHVEVVHGNAARTQFAERRFSTVTCLHVLHHVPTRAEQDALLTEIARVLRPGGALLCADALDHEGTRSSHQQQRETFVPLDPKTVRDRLQGLGFSQVEVGEADYQLLARATRGCLGPRSTPSAQDRPPLDLYAHDARREPLHERLRALPQRPRPGLRVSRSVAEGGRQENRGELVGQDRHTVGSTGKTRLHRRAG